MIVGLRRLYDFRRVGAGGSETAAKGCRVREKDGVGWDTTGLRREVLCKEGRLGCERRERKTKAKPLAG